MIDLSSFPDNPLLVFVSIVVAIFAAYTAFDTTECATNSTSRRSQLGWVALGGITLGGGIWAMHFIGMLAIHFDIPVHYDVGLTLGSLAIAAIASSLALFQISQPEWGNVQWVVGSLVQGGAVTVMHYTGMAAMRIPATMVMNPWFTALSIIIAIGASAAAQGILRHFDRVSHAREGWRWAASFVMGLAVSAMHYTAMAGVEFVPNAQMIPQTTPLHPARLAELVGAGIVVLCGITLVLTLSERRRTLQITLAQLQSTQIRLIQAEKLSSVGQLSAGISHEVNNPLAFLRGNLSYVESTVQDLFEIMSAVEQHTDVLPPEIHDKLLDTDWEFIREDFPKALQSMHNGVTRIQDIVRSLEVFSSCNESEVKCINLCGRIDDAIALLSQRLEATATRPEINIERQYESLPLMECFSGDILQAIFSILENAIEAIEQRWERDRHTLEETEEIRNIGLIQIEAKQLNDQQICLTIGDTGVGLDPTLKSKVFEPFFTTKEPGKGTGLGLTLALQTIRNHGGSIDLESPATGGTQVIITLPVYKVGAFGCQLKLRSLVENDTTTGQRQTTLVVN